MQSTWFIWLLLLTAIFIYLPVKKRRRYLANRISAKNRMTNEKGTKKTVVKELAEQMIGKTSM